jgi:hypothetical protein
MLHPSGKRNWKYQVSPHLSKYTVSYPGRLSEYDNIIAG